MPIHIQTSLCVMMCPVKGVNSHCFKQHVIGLLNWEPLKVWGSLEPLKSHLELSMCLDYSGEGIPRKPHCFQVSKGPYKSYKVLSHATFRVFA